MPQPTQRRTTADLYDLLEVSSQASPEVIRAAYYALARAWHTDVNASPEAGQRMRDLNAAYDVLGDSQRRAIYDLQRLRRQRRNSLSEQPVARAATARQTEARLLVPPASPAIHPTGVRTRGSRWILVILVLAAVLAALFVLVWAGLSAFEEPQFNTAPLIELRTD